MIAQVYPLKRMPRKCTVFDYLVPDDFVVQRGDIVTIPFREMTVYGVVARTKNQSLRGIELKSVASTTGYALREDELSFFEWLAFDLAQSVPSMLYHALPRPPKRAGQTHAPLMKRELTIPSDEGYTIRRNAEELFRRRFAFVHASDLRRSTAVIAKFLERHPEQKCLVVAPTVRDVKWLEAYLPGANGSLTGAESNNERFAIWQAYRKQTHGVLVGTKLALLLVDPTITTIFVVRSGHKSHKQSDCNPRFDARLTALGIAQRFQTNVFFFDSVPRVDDLTTFSTTNIISQGPSTPITIVNKRTEKQASPHPVVSYSVSMEIAKALEEKKTVVCVYNRKGIAQQLSCQACKHAFLCPNCDGMLRAWSHTVSCTRCSHVGPIPLSCPNCRSTTIFEKGFGNQRVAQVLALLFNVPVAIVDKDHPELSDHQILLVTQYYYEQHFNPFAPSRIGLVVVLDADAPLFTPTFRALEKTLQRIEEWRGFAYAHRAQFMLQTDSPELFQDFYANPQAVLEQELAERAALDLPPKRRWMQISFEDEEARKAELQAGILSKKIADLGIDLSVVGPIFDDKHHWHIELGVLDEHVNQLLTLFTSLDDQYIIDTNVFSC